MLYKLVVAPALVFAVVLILKLKGTIAQVSIFEAAMPALVTSSIVAEEYELHSKLSNLMIGISLIASFATTALWLIVLKQI
ncbi:MAG: transporter [Segetibacter sp.]|nr:transporter [Segetibacter sp.]